VRVQGQSKPSSPPLLCPQHFRKSLFRRPSQIKKFSTLVTLLILPHQLPPPLIEAPLSRRTPSLFLPPSPHPFPPVPHLATRARRSLSKRFLPPLPPSLFQIRAPCRLSHTIMSYDIGNPFPTSLPVSHDSSRILFAEKDWPASSLPLSRPPHSSLLPHSQYPGIVTRKRFRPSCRLTIFPFSFLSISFPYLSYGIPPEKPF